MAGVSSLIGVIASSAQKIQDKLLEASRSVSNIQNSWEGEDHTAFNEAYSKLNKKANNINEDYKKIDSKIRSLQTSIEAAERAKEEKRRSAYK